MVSSDGTDIDMSEKDLSRFCLLFKQMSNSDEVADDDDDGDDGADDSVSDDDDAWLVDDGSDTGCVSPTPSFDFNVGLSLDSLFKPTDSSKCLVNDKSNCTLIVPSYTLPADSSTICTNNNPDLRLNLLRTGNYDDIDFQLCAVSDDGNFVADECLASFERLKEVNARWDDYYSDSGYESNADLEKQTATQVLVLSIVGLRLLNVTFTGCFGINT